VSTVQLEISKLTMQQTEARIIRGRELYLLEKSWISAWPRMGSSTASVLGVAE
jgi:hypothetical protein